MIEGETSPQTPDQPTARHPEGARARQPAVAVLVPVLDEAAHIRSTIGGLQAQDYAGETSFVFLDGGSTDGTAEILAEMSGRDARITVVANPRRIVPAGLNVGLAATRADVVARMDAHTRYPATYLRVGVERLMRGDVASVSGPMLAEGDSDWARRIALALGTKLGTGEALYRHLTDQEIEVDSGFTGLWWRSTLIDHGGWDEDTYPNEDAELAVRIRDAGGRIVCVPQMAARYHPRDGLKPLALQYWRYGQYRARTAVRHPNSMRRSHVLAPGLALATLFAIAGPRSLTKTARAGLSLYAVAVAGVALDQSRRSPRRDAATLPAIFMTMHLSWGFGFLRGIMRFGFPGPALARILRTSLPTKLGTDHEENRESE